MSAQSQDVSSKKTKCLGWCEGKNPVVEDRHYCKECDDKRIKISRSHHLFSFAGKPKSSFRSPPLL